MDHTQIDSLINAVLYEGYLLYPYRPSLKNAKRWNFGTLYPVESGEVRLGTERATTRARILIVGGPAAMVEGELRFLQLIERTTTEPADDPQVWHEAEERRVSLPAQRCGPLSTLPSQQHFYFPGRTWSEAGFRRRQQPIQGTIELSFTSKENAAQLLTVTITNDTPCEAASGTSDRDEMALTTFASPHLILRTQDAEFVSRIDPPAAFAELCPTDPADGLWPVLVGTPGNHSTVLCSPIILYDYPEIAPESPGDFFDATEIDEMLTLRILTLSDEEKRQMSEFDARGRALLNRTAALAEQLGELHGVTRSFRQIQETADER